MPESYDPDNIFAKILKGTCPCFKIYENTKTLAFMDLAPRADGHALVIPKTPARNLLDARLETLFEVIETAQKVAIAAKEAMKADGVTLHQFSEAAGGQAVFHLHFHVIPRWNGIELRPVAGIKASEEDLTRHARQIASLLPPSF